MAVNIGSGRTTLTSRALRTCESSSSGRFLNSSTMRRPETTTTQFASKAILNGDSGY